MITIAALIFSGLLAALAYGLYNSRRVRFRTLRVGSVVVTGNEPLKELEVLHISDIHSSRKTAHKLAKIESLSEKLWDFVFITGDLIEDDTGIEHVSAALGKLKTRYGKFAVLGNHDYYSYRPRNVNQWFKVVFGNVLKLRKNFCRVANDIERLLEKLDQNGVRVLRNDVVEGVTEQGRSYQVFGIDDPKVGRDNPAALYRYKNFEALRLVLMHSPERLENILPLEPEIVMCGHTHGGQVRVPFFGALYTDSDAPRKGASGFVSIERCRLHISSGFSAGLAFPYRFYSPPEITQLIISQSVCSPPESVKTT
ncbi:metallophosphoesterase [Gemmatimonadota bacterium]